ncbi:hypothetical protein A2164_03205 [Candidatus Curtissbacteria bacterium RBG_13_35_7]|uniref:Endonuclease/exonuclease/phosphatase domain-containing protein n=1 Tax=Candidatus Curtissbacteria bacterium RBG_13_35_7 TaxID=1797705 RepID=A0A1F5G1N4_9BACT|nr:MAG: hypothetical protein A2164_03205 [Candidatus Curtissbacteria bacterium RBG_13_35_7]
MIIKFIQLNVFKGQYLDLLVDFLLKEDADFIVCQEVTIGKFNNYSDKSINLFEILKDKLNLEGVFHGDLKIADFDNSLFGNAVFSKRKISSHYVLPLKTFRPLTKDELDGSGAVKYRPIIPRHLLDANIFVNKKIIHVISWHGAWTAPPQDTKETLRQAKLVRNYLKNLNEPFILGGDLNNVIQSKTVGLINKVANNLMLNSGILQTTNPEVHKISPKGHLIDYIFTSDEFRLKSIRVEQVTVSDHLPVIAELEF